MHLKNARLRRPRTSPCRIAGPPITSAQYVSEALDVAEILILSARTDGWSLRIRETPRVMSPREGEERCFTARELEQHPPYVRYSTTSRTSKRGACVDSYAVISSARCSVRATSSRPLTQCLLRMGVQLELHHEDRLDA